MRKFILVFLIITVCLFNIFCGKDKAPVPVATLSKSFLNYIYFLEGSYWVYQDSVTFYEDSSWAFDSYIDTFFLEDSRDRVKEKWERFHYKFVSNNKVYKFLGENVCSVKIKDTSIICYLTSYWNINNSEIQNYFFFYPLKVENEESGVKLTNFYDSLKINNNTFYNVARMYRSQNEIENGYETVFYIAKNIGIIRKEIEYKQGKWEIWNLARYNIVQ